VEVSDWAIPATRGPFLPTGLTGLGLHLRVWGVQPGEPTVGLNSKAFWRKEKIPRVQCFKPFWFKHTYTHTHNLIRGDSGDFVCSLFPPSSPHLPLLSAPHKLCPWENWVTL
jgi:hypothetical protein